MPAIERKRGHGDGPLKIAVKRIVLFATDAFATPTFEAIIKAGYEVPVLVTEPEHPVQTGPDVIAGGWRIPTLELGRSANEEGELRGHKPDLFLVVGFGAAIPKPWLEIPAGGTVKLHPSLLPRCRGARPIERAILNGEGETGVTAFLFDDEGETGPILHAKAVALGEDKNAGELRSQLSLLAAEVAVETLAGLAEGRFTPRPQNEALASQAPLLKAGEERIDWKLSATALSRRIRAFNPAPGARTEIGEHELLIDRAQPEGPASAPPGTLVESRFDGIVVACGENTALRVTQLHLEGQRPMSPSAFVSRHRLSAGSRFS